MRVTKQLPVAIDFHSIFSPIKEVNGYRQLFGTVPYKHSLKYLILCLAKKRNSYNLKQLEDK